MSKGWRVATLALVLASLSPIAAEARPSPEETVRIRFRHSYPICAGVCPDYRLAVGPEGDVVTQNLLPRERYRFRASPLQREAFLRILGTIRPLADRRLDARCEHGILGDGRPDPDDDPRPDDMEILWMGADAQTRLTSCAYSHPDIRQTVESALRALGANPFSGDRDRPEDH